MPRYLITTGVSKTGAATIKALKALGVASEDIVAGTRNPSKTDSQLKALGAGHVVHLDHENDESIEKALIGVDRVLLSVGGHLRLTPVYERFAKIASKSGSSVKALVAIGAILNGTGEVAKDFAGAEKVILESGVESKVSVAPSWFFENWKLPSILSQLHDGTVYGSSGDGKVAYIAAQDIGNVVASVLLNPTKYNGQRLEITGPDSLTEAEIAHIVSKYGIGKEAKWVNIPESAFRAALSSMDVNWQDYLYELEVIKASGHASPVTTTVQDVTGKAPTSLREWVLQQDFSHSTVTQ